MEGKLNFENLREKGEMRPIPGFKATEYLAHCPTGNLYSLISGKWLLQNNPKGTGGSGNCYLMTSLKDENGKFVRMYLHELIISSFMGIKKADWSTIGLEVNYISKDMRDCSIGNLELTSSKGNKATKDHVINRGRLSAEIAEDIRNEFEDWDGSKAEWYQKQPEKYSVSARSIQNIILGATYKEKVA